LVQAEEKTSIFYAHDRLRTQLHLQNAKQSFYQPLHSNFMQSMWYLPLKDLTQELALWQVDAESF
jgi:hypothetical protein